MNHNPTSFTSRIRSIRAFTLLVLRQITRDRSTLFFFAVLPVVIIVIIGATFGAVDSVVVGVHRGAGGSQVADAVIARLEASDGVAVREYDSLDDLRGAVRRQGIGAGVAFADDTDAAVAAGAPAIDVVLADGSQEALATEVVVNAAISATLAPLDAARFAAETSGTPEVDALTAARSLQATVPASTVSVVDVGDGRGSGSGELSQFALTAPQNLVLFVFLNSMAGGAALVHMRRRGVLRRVLAGPIGTGDVVIGLVAGWFVLAMFQSVIILAVGGIGFGVDWGDPVAAALLVMVFALVSAGAGVLVGALGADADRVTALSPPVGITLASIGGCTVPLEVFPAAMVTFAHAVPHYWAITAWQDLVFDGDGVADIAPQLGVLALFAVAFVTLGSLALRRMLRRGAA